MSAEGKTCKQDYVLHGTPKILIHLKLEIDLF